MSFLGTAGTVLLVILAVELAIIALDLLKGS